MADLGQKTSDNPNSMDAKTQYKNWLNNFYKKNEEPENVYNQKQKEYIQTYLMKRLGKYNSQERLQMKTDSSDVNRKLLADHYGKWYLKPHNFNDSMLAHQRKLTKPKKIRQE